MKLLESIAISSKDGMALIQEGTNLSLFESDTIDGYSKSDLEGPSVGVDTKELSKKVQKWLSSAKDQYLSKGMQQETWEVIVSEMLQLIKILESGDKEAVTMKIENLKLKPLQDKIADKVVKSVYQQVSPKLGTFEIMKKTISQEDIESLSSIIIEAIEKSLVLVD